MTSSFETETYFPQVVRRQKWKDTMAALNAFPPAPFDLSIDHLPRHYSWVRADAESFSKEGLMGIYLRGGMRFICLREFADAREQILGQDPDPPCLPHEYKLDRTLHEYKMRRAAERFPEYRNESGPLGQLTMDTFDPVHT